MYKENEMNILVRYLNKDGYLVNYVAQINHNIDNPELVRNVYNEVVKKFADNIILIRGYIEDIPNLKTTANKIETNIIKLDIKKKNLTYYTLREPAFGSIEECIRRNLTIEFQEISAKFNPYGTSVTINLINVNSVDDVYNLVLSEVRDSGIYTYVYRLNFKFESDWSSTCDSCINGLAHVRSELDRISAQLYVNETSPVTTSGNIISDLIVHDATLLSDQIKLLLANAIKLSKIADFTIQNITDEFKGIDYGKAAT